MSGHHSPTPWKVESLSPVFSRIVDAEGSEVVGKMSKDNAVFIVQAANAFTHVSNDFLDAMAYANQALRPFVSGVDYAKAENGMSELVQWPMARYWHRAWNPVIGCKPVSPACVHCWASGWADRFKQSFEPHESGNKTPPRRGVVFCGNMTDLWGDWNLVHEFGGYFHKSCDWIAETLGHNPKNPYKDKAVYLWLTKRAATMAEWVADGGWETWRCLDEADCIDFKYCDMSNQFFGCTAENQECYDKRLAKLTDNLHGQKPEWMNLWLSVEPLLGPIDLGFHRMETVPFKWVVVGCESGPNRRPCGMGWVESVVAQCLSAGVTVFVKQLDIGGKCVTDINQFPKDLRIRQVPWKVTDFTWKQKGATA